MSNNQIIIKIENEINNEIKIIINKLDGEKLLLYLLMQQEIMFSTLTDSHQDYKEKISESFSYCISLIKQYKKINTTKLQKYNITSYIDKKKNILDNLISLLLTKSKITDFKIYVNKQGYKLHYVNDKLTISHEIKDYIKYYKLGYLRNVIEDTFLTMMSIKNNEPDFMKIAQKAFEKQIKFFKIVEQGTTKERIRFFYSNALCNILLKIQDANSEYKTISAFDSYFKNSNVDINDNCLKSISIKWSDILKLSILTSRLSYFMDNTIKDNCLNHDTMFNNSIIFPFSNDNLFNLFKLIFNEINKDITEKEIQQFIIKFTTDLTKLKISDKFDIQFKPILKVDNNFNILLFRTFGATNIIRAFISNYQIGLDEQGTKFENNVKKTFSQHFKNIATSIKFQNQEGEKGEIDLCILGNKNIYFIECKNRLHPISASSSINNYEYIMKACDKQLPKAIQYFNEDKTSFVKKSFGQTAENIKNFKIHKIVLLSNRNLSGLNFNDVAIRDIYSLERILSKGYASIGTISNNDKESFETTSDKIYFWENESNFQEIDLINYLSIDSKFFRYLEQNVAIEQKRKFQYKQYIFEDMVFAYNASYQES